MTQGAYQPPPGSPEPDLPTEETEAPRRDPGVVDLLHALSHDLRGPLTLVSGVLQTMTRSGVAPADPELRSLVESAWDGTRRMREILDDFLAVVDVALGDGELHPRPVDPAAILRHAVAQDERLAPVVTVRSSGLPRITIDPLYLGRAVTYLVRAQLAAGSSRVTVDVAAGSTRLVVVVLGDRPAISPTTAAGGERRAASADALGLSGRLSAALAAAMGGRLTVLPVPGGMSVRLVFPSRREGA